MWVRCKLFPPVVVTLLPVHLSQDGDQKNPEVWCNATVSNRKYSTELSKSCTKQRQSIWDIETAAPWKWDKCMILFLLLCMLVPIHHFFPLIVLTLVTHQTRESWSGCQRCEWIPGLADADATAGLERQTGGHREASPGGKTESRGRNTRQTEPAVWKQEESRGNEGGGMWCSNWLN